MIQIDSIRVNGLRNHEIAWAARTDAPVEELYKLFYRDRGMLETHYPQFATRRDWLPWFVKDFHRTISDLDRLRELRPMMRRLKKRMRRSSTRVRCRNRKSSDVMFWPGSKVCAR